MRKKVREMERERERETERAKGGFKYRGAPAPTKGHTPIQSESARVTRGHMLHERTAVFLGSDFMPCLQMGHPPLHETAKV